MVLVAIWLVIAPKHTGINIPKIDDFGNLRKERIREEEMPPEADPPIAEVIRG